MANEAGYFNGGAGAAATFAIFAGDKTGNIAAGIYTAVGSQQINAVRFSLISNAAATLVTVGLFLTSAGAITGAPLNTVGIAVSANNTIYSASGLTWALSNGSSYALAIVGVDAGLISLSTDTRTNGQDNDTSGGAIGASWSRTSTGNFALELAGDVVAGAAAQPGQPWDRQGAMGVMVAM
jgi:hypothetical protein